MALKYGRPIEARLAPVEAKARARGIAFEEMERLGRKGGGNWSASSSPELSRFPV